MICSDMDQAANAGHETALQYAAFVQLDDGLLHLLASGEKVKNAMQVEQDVNIYVGQVSSGQTIRFNNDDGRQSYVYLLEGQMRANRFALDAGDALKVRNKESLCFSAIAESHLLIVETSLE